MGIRTGLIIDLKGRGFSRAVPVPGKNNGLQPLRRSA